MVLSYAMFKVPLFVLLIALLGVLKQNFYKGNKQAAILLQTLFSKYSWKKHIVFERPYCKAP